MIQIRKILIALFGVFVLSVGFSPTGLVASDKILLPYQKLTSASLDNVVEIMKGSTPGSIERVVHRNGRIIEKLVFWNNQPWELTRYDYFDDVPLYYVSVNIFHGEKPYIVRQDLLLNSEKSNRPDRKIETRYYHFDRGKANSLRQVDTYWPDSGLIRERRVYNNSKVLKNLARFEFDIGAQDCEPDTFGNIDAVSRMTLVNIDGNIISDYCENTDLDPTSLYYRLNFSKDEINRRMRIFQDPTRTPILILDGGIDINHPDLAYKLWKNPIEQPNGEDDDGNGLTDDIFGVSDNPRLGQPVHDLRLPRFGLPPFSHGTLVASIASQGREDVAIMAASEMTANRSSEIFKNIERFINSHGVRFTNMSFLFDQQLLDPETGTQRPQKVKYLIQHTPNTLHVVAAGNGAPINGKGFNVDKLCHDEDLVPVMLSDDNILVVGALNTDQLNPIDYPTYQLASFGNVGEISVDILAPGIQMCGARMGGGFICKDGTSFSAPYVLNHGVLNVANANPDLNIHEIKEIILKTAYIPDLHNPFPVRSGGILHPQRAVAAAKWLAAHPSESVEMAVLAVRKLEPVPIAGERNDSIYLSDLQSYWLHQGLGHAGSWYARAEKKRQFESPPTVND